MPDDLSNSEQLDKAWAWNWDKHDSYVMPFDSLWRNEKYEEGKEDADGNRDIFFPVYLLKEVEKFVILFRSY